ncbi:MAG: IS481 family transposase [Proteobacteria bacterium]|nr:MAG: IS481 family transposase [Pseudomonadota bacterium]QKK12337.1 MAG: IS481 family transposase [Pseudomonadota bacterium]
MNQSTQRIIGNKVGLLNLAQELGNVSKACQMMGVSRDTFYRYKSARDEGGVEALLDKTRRKPNPKNRVEPQVEQAVLDFALEYPAHGQVRVSNELRKQGVFVSPSGVRSIWLRHQLQSRKLRLRALEAKVAEEGLVLTEAQVIALERQQTLNEAHGEIEAEHPGYLGSQDTYYVGTIKGIGRIYQQTFVDTYSKVAACKLYTTKTPITAADLLNDRVLPLLESEGIDLLRILTDRGTEFCGRPERHDYQLYLAINDIDHTRTKAYSPQTNGICERFHRTVKEEFYEVAFRKKVYSELDKLQADLDVWVDHYNNERTHQGKMCCGRTPMQTLRDGRMLWDEKVSNLN